MELNGLAYKTADTEGKFALRNSLRQAYVSTIKNVAELLKLYKKYTAAYRFLYPQIHVRAHPTVLPDIHEKVGELLKEINSFLNSEKRDPSGHPLAREITAFIVCIESVLDYRDPKRSVLSRAVETEVQQLVQLFFSLEIGLEDLLKDPRFSPEGKYRFFELLKQFIFTEN